MSSCSNQFTKKEKISLAVNGLPSFVALLLSIISIFFTYSNYNEEKMLNNIERFQLHRNMFFNELKILEKGLKHVEFIAPRKTYLLFFPHNDTANVEIKLTQSDLDEGLAKDYGNKVGERKVYRLELASKLTEIPSNIRELEKEVRKNGYSSKAGKLTNRIEEKINSTMWQLPIKINGHDSLQHMKSLDCNISKEIEYVTTIISTLFNFASYHDFKENFRFSKRIMEFSFLKSNLDKYKRMLNDSQFRLLNIILSMQELIITNNMTESKTSKELLWKSPALIAYMKNETKLEKHIEMLADDIIFTYGQHTNFTTKKTKYDQLMNLNRSLTDFY